MSMRCCVAPTWRVIWHRIKVDSAFGKTHLTGMNARTTLSAKGQVVIPKDVRDRLKLAAGDKLEVVERPDGVLLRKNPTKLAENFDTVTRRIRTLVNYTGPIVSIEEMDRSLAEMWIAGGPRWDK